jgi:hypothetical protein
VIRTSSSRFLPPGVPMRRGGAPGLDVEASDGL